MPSCASICFLAVLHNLFSGNKKPQNKGFRGTSLNGLITTANRPKNLKIPLFSYFQAISGKVLARFGTDPSLVD